MTLDEALEHWRRERERLAGIEDWVEEGKPTVPPSLRQSLDKYARLNSRDAKQALKDLRRELEKDAFLRMFSAFERELRATFAEWLRTKCGTTTPVDEVEKDLPEMLGVLEIARCLEPRFDQSQFGHATTVRDLRNKLVHRGFAVPMTYDLEDLHRKFATVIALFK
jgi:hypothetical protein